MSVIRNPLSGLKVLAENVAARMRSLKYTMQYGSTAPKSYEILWVDPKRVEYCTLPSLMGQLGVSRYGSHVIGGNWDRRDEYDEVWYTRSFDPPVIARFENHELYRSMVHHFLDHVPWEETAWYQWIADNPGEVGQYHNTRMM
jgi:hypothetical protein